MEGVQASYPADQKRCKRGSSVPDGSNDTFKGEPVSLLDNDYLTILGTPSIRSEIDYHY